MSSIPNLVFSSTSSSRPQYQHKAQPRSLDAPPPLPPASSWTRHRGPSHRRTVSFDATSGDSSKDDPRSELVVLLKENRRFKRKIEHLALQKEVYHDLLEKSGIEIPDVLETPASQAEGNNEPAVTENTKRSDTATARTDILDPIPYWINASNHQAKLLQVLIAMVLGRARTTLHVSPSDHAKIEALATEAFKYSLHSSLKKDRALIAHCQFYLGIARFGQGRFTEAAEFLDGARAAVAGRYLDGELVDEWVDRCSDAMGEPQSPTWTDPSIPSGRASQANNKGKGKEALHGWTFPNSNTAATTLSPPPPTHLQQPTTPSAAATPTHHRHSSSAHSILSAATTIRPPSPPPSTPFKPSYLHSYASASHSPPRSAPPLPADFPILALVNSQDNSSATARATSPNAFSPGGAFSSPPSSVEGTPDIAQGAFVGTPSVPTHRRGRSGGNGSGAGISSKLAFWEGQRGGSGSNSSPVEGVQRHQQQRSASPEEEQRQHQSPPLVSEAGAESDNDSEDEQRRHFLNHQEFSSSSDESLAGDQGEVLAGFFSSRTNSHRSSDASLRGRPPSSIFGDGTRRMMTTGGEQSPIADHQGETVATFWSSRANSLRSETAAPSRRPSSSSSSMRSEVLKTEHRQPPSRTNSVFANSTRPSRTQSLLSQASLHSVAESEEEEEEEGEGEGGEAAMVGSRVGSRRGSEGSGSGSEKGRHAAGSRGGEGNGGVRRKKQQKGRRRERRASRAAA